MIYGILTSHGHELFGTERRLIMSESVITIRDWVEAQQGDLEGLEIFRPHEIMNLDD